MALPTIQKVAIKTEGTTQTFGQLIVFPARKDVSSMTTNQQSSVTPVDTVVKVVANPVDSGVNLSVNDTDRSKIAIAAATTTKEAAVVLDRTSIAQENLLEGVNVGTFARVKINEIDHAIVVGSLIKSKDEVSKAMAESQKVDMMICLKSKESEVLEFNNLKEPAFEVQMVYNFFIPEEEDVLSQEDQSQDPFLKGDIFDVPRYVELKWTPVDVTEEFASIESLSVDALEMKRDVFGKQRGVVSATSANFKNSFEKSKKKFNPIDRDGVKREVVDIHQLDVALNSTANKSVFANSVRAVVNIKDTPNTISQIPIKK